MSSLDQRFSNTLHPGRGCGQALALRAQAGSAALRRLLLREIDARQMAVASAVPEPLPRRREEAA